MMSFTLVSIILFSVSISLLVANLSGIPQSTSQSTVLAVVAPALYFNNLNSGKLFFMVIPAWFILPVIAFIISYLLGRYIYHPMRKRGYTLTRAQNANMKPIWNGLILGNVIICSFLNRIK